MDGKTSVTFSKATTQRASEVIYEQIYQKIASGELKHGDRLPSERELAEQFGRSRPSIREALRMLQQDGLLEISVGTNGGATVRGISLELAKPPLEKLIESGTITAKELVEYRMYNDRCCAMLALQYHTDEDAASLKELLERFEAAIPDSELFEKIDLEYHKMIARASHNKLCVLITDVITSLCTSVFWSLVAANLNEEEQIEINQAQYVSHKAIVDAMIAKDSDALMEAVEKNAAVFYQTVNVAL